MRVRGKREREITRENEQTKKNVCTLKKGNKDQCGGERERRLLPPLKERLKRGNL